MAVTDTNKWLIAASAFGVAAVIFNPYMYRLMDMIFASKNWIAEDEGKKPTLAGFILHLIVFFFVMFGVMNIDWECE